MMAALRPVVLCADDYACSAGVSEAVRRLALGGRLTATSAMVLAPRWPEDAAPLRELRGRLDVGLHLDFTSEFAVAAGHGLPLGAAMRRALLGGFDRAAARAVIERQLDAFEAAWQAPPDHVDGHQHVQQFAGVREPLVELLARRYGAQAPWLRVSRPPAGLRDLKSRVIGWMGANALESIAAGARLPRAKWLSGIYDFSGGEVGYARHMVTWLARAPAATVLMCHPALPQTAGSEGGDAIAPARAWEYTYLASPAFPEQCASAGVQLQRGRDLYTAAV